MLNIDENLILLCRLHIDPFMQSKQAIPILLEQLLIIQKTIINNNIKCIIDINSSMITTPNHGKYYIPIIFNSINDLILFKLGGNFEIESMA